MYTFLNMNFSFSVVLYMLNDTITNKICFLTVPIGAPRNVRVTVESSRSIMLTWERPSLEEENDLLLQYHVIAIETQIHYTDDGAEITGIQRYLNRTYNASEGRTQLIDSLHPDYNYTVRIAAATEPGIGPFSDAITVRTDMDGECTSWLYETTQLFV